MKGFLGKKVGNVPANLAGFFRTVHTSGADPEGLPGFPEVPKISNLFMKSPSSDVCLWETRCVLQELPP